MIIIKKRYGYLITTEENLLNLHSDLKSLKLNIMTNDSRNLTLISLNALHKLERLQMNTQKSAQKFNLILCFGYEQQQQLK